MKRDTRLEDGIATHRDAASRALMRLAYNECISPYINSLYLIGNSNQMGNFRFVGMPRYALPVRRAQVWRETVNEMIARGWVGFDRVERVKVTLTQKGRREANNLMNAISARIWNVQHA